MSFGPHPRALIVITEQRRAEVAAQADQLRLVKLIQPNSDCSRRCTGGSRAPVEEQRTRAVQGGGRTTSRHWDRRFRLDENGHHCTSGSGGGAWYSDVLTSGP